MSDKENNRDIFIKRLEEFHIEETSSTDLLSDEEILRWERMAKVRRAEKARKTKAFLSAAAVLLLAIIIGTAIAIGPPDVHAGGEGGSEIVDMTEGDNKEIIHYKTVDSIPKTIKESILFFNDSNNNLELRDIKITKIKKILQIEIIYHDADYGEIVVNEIIGNDNLLLEEQMYKLKEKENVKGTEVYISSAPEDESKRTYSFIYKNIYVCVYSEEANKGYIKKIIEEAL